ncbi:MAG: hypothetical protein ACOYJV_09320 [Aminivibrio sp.]
MIGMITTTPATRLSTHGWLSVTGISITGDIPGDTDVRLALRAGGGPWKKWDTSQWVNLPEQSLTAENLLQSGNTLDEIETLTESDLEWLCGEEIDAAIALSAESIESPELEMVAIEGVASSDVYSKTLESTPLMLSKNGDAVQILKIDHLKSTSANGEVLLTCSMLDGSGNWSEWVPLEGMEGQFAVAIKLRARLTVSVIDGPDQAAITSVTLDHRIDNVAIFSEGTGQIVTRTYEFLHEMGKCHLMCKRPIVKDASLRAYVALRPHPINVERELLGAGTGSPAVFTLANPEGVAPHSLRIEVNGEVTGAYNFNSATAQITITAPAGSEIRATYQHSWELEEWIPMAKDAEYPDTQSPLVVNDQFNYFSGAEGPRGSVSAIKVELEQGRGSIEGEALGTATGISQPFSLAHRPREGHIQVKANGALLDPSAYYWDDEGSLLWVTGPSGAELTADYQWLGLPPSVRSIAAVWNV